MATTDVTERPKRMTLSHVLDRMLERSSAERAAVTIIGDGERVTRIEVTARAEEIEDAEERAQAAYDRLDEKYRPARNGPVENYKHGLTRNAKGDTQIALEGSGRDVEAVETVIGESFERTRRQFPMASGYVGAEPPSNDE